MRLFHGAELSPAGAVNLANDADNIRLDARTGNLVVGYDDLRPGMRVLASLTHPEGFQLDTANRRAFCALQRNAT